MPFVHVWFLHKHGVLGCSTHDPARGSKEEREVEIEEEREGGGREGGEGEGRLALSGRNILKLASICTAVL